jgi:uncharacterized membrane protein
MDDIKPAGEKSIFGAILFFIAGLPLFLIGMILVLTIIFSKSISTLESIGAGGFFAILMVCGLWFLQRARAYYNGTAKSYKPPKLNFTFLITLQISYALIMLLKYLKPYFPVYSSPFEIIMFLLFLSPYIVWIWLKIKRRQAK